MDTKGYEELWTDARKGSWDEERKKAAEILLQLKTLSKYPEHLAKVEERKKILKTAQKKMRRGESRAQDTQDEHSIEGVRQRIKEMKEGRPEIVTAEHKLKTPSWIKKENAGIFGRKKNK